MLGMWRLLKPLDFIWGRVVGTLLYAALPVPYNALVHGRWGTLLLVAALPLLFAELSKRSVPQITLPKAVALAQSASLVS